MTGEIKAITSLTNTAVKATRALHMRKEREETGLFLAEGLKIIGEAVELGHAPQILMFSKDAGGHPVLDRAITATFEGGGEVLEVSRDILEKTAKRDNPQTVLGVFKQTYAPLPIGPAAEQGVFVALEGVRDPGNLGTIIRTADAAGLAGVILIGDTCDPFSVEAVRATMGSVFALPISKTRLEDFLTWRAQAGMSLIGTHLKATTDFRQADYRRPCVILMGTEQSGLTDAASEACDVRVKIPMLGRADSLNLSIATAVMIYAVAIPPAI